MVHIILFILAGCFSILGVLLIIQILGKDYSKNRTSNKNRIYRGLIGIFLIWCAGIITIYFLSIGAISDNTTNKNITPELPDISSNHT